MSADRSDMLRPGERIGPLRVERTLGVGGMGEVYLARDERLERLVAVKLLPSTRSLDTAARGRMLREARAASALKHPGIVTVYDIGDHGGRAYIVMEYVDGETFDAVVARRGRLPPEEAVALVAQVADAVAAAHDAGVLHRDLKSANLMLDDAGHVKVLDFGLSKRTDATPSAPPERATPSADPEAPTASPDDAFGPTATPISGAEAAPEPDTVTTAGRSDEPQTVHGARMGTMGWAPPELIDGRPADVRSDVFALGCVLHHLLTGRLPFPGAGWTKLREEIERGAAPPSKLERDVPPALDKVVLSALAADPARRPASARVFRAAARAAVAPRRWGRVAVVAAVVAAMPVAVIAWPRGGTRAAARAVVVDAGVAAVAPAPSPLTRAGGCAYSPTFVDDDTIAYDLTTAGAVDLYQLDLDGEPVQLTSTAGWEWRSSRGASAHELVFLSQAAEVGAIDTIDLVTRTRRPLLDRNGAIVYATDAYYYAPTMISELRRLAGGEDEVFLTLPEGVTIETLVASNDGRRLAASVVGGDARRRVCTIELADPALVCVDTVIGDGRPAFGGSATDIYVPVRTGIARVAAGARRPALVIPDADASGGIAVSPSGRTLVYSTCRGRSDLVSVLEDPTRALLDDHQVTRFALGADGALVYVRGEDDGSASVMVRLPGKPLRQVLHLDGSVLDLALSPDGQAMVYARGGSAEAGIYLLALGATNAPNRLTEGATDRSPVFAGERVAFVRWTDEHVPRLMTVERDGQGETTLGNRPRLLEAADPSHGRLLLADPGLPHLYWWDLATGRETRGPKSVVSNPQTVMALSPSGRWLLTLGGNNGQEVWRQDLEGGGEPERVFDVREDRSTVGGAIDEEGRPLITIRTWEGELWQVAAPADRPW